MTDFIFLGCKITADGNWSRENKRHLLLGGKVMTNLYSILKSRDIIFLTKIWIVKAMVFSSSPVLMWELDHKEAWALKNWCFRTMVLERTLESSFDCKEIKLINLKGNQSVLNICWKDWFWSSNTLATWCEADSLEKILMLAKTEGKRRRGQQRMRCLDNITDSMDLNLNKLWETVVKDKGVWYAVVHGVAKSQTWFNNWTTATTNSLKIFILFYHWTIIALQCCAGFCCTTKWISCMYNYTPSLLTFLPPLYVITRHHRELSSLGYTAASH